MLEFILKIQICPWALIQGPWFKTICGLGSCPEAGSRLDALSLPSVALVPQGLLWMPKGQLYPQKPAPRKDTGCQGLPGLPFPSADPWQWEPFMPHTRLALCVEGWSCLHEKRPCAGEQ